MTGFPVDPDEGPVLEPTIDVPLTDPDLLPLDEVTLRREIVHRGTADERAYWYWRIEGLPESLVGYGDRDLARRKGAEELRRRRQLAAMREP